MTFLNNSKKVLSVAQAEGKVVKLRKLIQLDQESLHRPDSFLNRHAKVEARLDKYYVELEAAEQAFRELMDNI